MFKDDFVISVIIPCYNSELTIERCIESVLQQSFPVYEIIVVDDGSIDNSLSFLMEIKSRVSFNINIISQKNEGPSSARNNGIISAKGNWIAFLDSDDYWYINKIEEQIKYIGMYDNIDFCGTSYEKKYFPDQVSSMIIGFKELCHKNYFATPSVLVKRDLLQELRFDVNQKYSEDYKLWLYIAYSHKCLYVNKILSKNIENKEVFGEKGLSSKLLEMELGELKNYSDLLKSGYISRLDRIEYSIFSITKFFRRVILSIVIRF